MRIVIHRPLKKRSSKKSSSEKAPLKSGSESLVVEAISKLEAAIKVERCGVCKTWILNSKKYVEDKFNNLKYSQEIYDIMKTRGISKPWQELDDETKEELKREAKRGR